MDFAPPPPPLNILNVYNEIEQQSFIMNTQDLKAIVYIVSYEKTVKQQRLQRRRRFHTIKKWFQFHLKHTKKKRKTQDSVTIENVIKIVLFLFTHAIWFLELLWMNLNTFQTRRKMII